MGSLREGELHSANLLGRNTVEDGYLRLHDEHIHLKKYAREQEDKIKKLATKVSRLVNQRKAALPAHRQSFEMEQVVEDLNDKIRTLEKENTHLKGKLLVTRQMITASAKRRDPYEHVRPRVDTGRQHSTQPWKIHNQLTMKRAPGNLTTAFAASVLEEARNEIKRLESAVASRQSLLDIKEQELEGLKEQMQVRDAEHKEELVQLRIGQTGHGQLQHLQENVDLIKLHHEVKSHSAREAALQNDMQDLRTQLQKMSASHGSALKEVELVTSQLKSEQQKNRELQDKLGASELIKQKVPELEECVKDLQRENDILKEANNKLLETIEEVDKAFCHVDVEDSLRARIAQLEAVVNSDAEEKKELLLQVALHKEACTNLSSKYEVVQKQHAALIHEDEQLKAKVSLLEQESRALHEELHASRMREVQMRESVAFATKEPETRLEQASTQTDQEDVLLLTGQKNSKTHILKELQEDVLQKNIEIQKMEGKMKHILQKSQHVKIAEVCPPEESDSDTYGSLLHKGQSFFEIHISRVVFTSENFHPIKDSSLFVRWTFSDFEPQATPATSSDWPEFNCTARYAIDVSREFLEFLEKGSVKLEAQEVVGVSERPLGVSELSLKSSLKNAFKRHRVRLPLLGTCNGKVVLGALCGWTRFLPTPDAASQFLGVTAPVPVIRDHKEQVIQQRRESENGMTVNLLHVEILKCSALPLPNDASSFVYCQYSLYHHPYQNTNAVPSSETVEFQDHRNFPLKMDSSLHIYLLNTNLDVFIFDTRDNDPGSYIGKASIGLAPLTTSTEIKGSFSFFNVHNENVGYVEVFLHWENEYKAQLRPLLKARPMHRTSRHPNATSGSFESKLHVRKCSSAPSRSQQHLLKLMRPSSAAVGTKDPQKRAPSHHPHQKPYSPDAGSLTSVSSISSHEAKDIASSEQPSPDESSTRDNAAPVSDPKLSISVGECQNGNEESDSSRDVVIKSPPRKQIVLEPSDVAVFSINSLGFLPGAAVLKDKSVEMLFVEFHFLDCPPAELETPFSLPKMKPPQRALFNFRKVVHLDTMNHASRRELLAGMVTSKASSSATVTFTIVSEPSNNSEKAECKDIGTATADLKQILKSGRDIVEEDIAVISCTNKRPIGRLNISVEILAALRSILASRAPP